MAIETGKCDLHPQPGGIDIGGLTISTWWVTPRYGPKVSFCQHF